MPHCETRRRDDAAAKGARAPGRWFAAASLIVLPACAFERYAPEPLESRRVASDFVRERRAWTLPAAPEHGASLSLDHAADLLRERNPALRDAFARFRAAEDLAEVPTPLPNPELLVGPEFGYGPDAASPYVVPLARLAFTVPTAGKRSKRDDWLAAVATERFVDFSTTCSEVYLDLRRRFVELVVARAQSEVREEIVAASQRSLSVARDLVEAGEANALDVSLFRLEHAREKSRRSEASFELADAEADFAALVSVPARSLGPVSIAMLPEPIAGARDLEALTSRLPETRPDLLRARAAYETAEQALRLEVARQYPDVTVGFGAKGETGESVTILDLMLGLGLPVFDRNQQGVTAAAARRREARTAFETAVSRGVSDLERAHRAAALAEERRDILRDEVLPAARSNVEIAHRALPAGSGSALQVLDAERSLREVELELLEAELGLRLAWCDVERAFGAPLLDFPSSDRDVDGAEGARGDE